MIPRIYFISFIVLMITPGVEAADIIVNVLSKENNKPVENAVIVVTPVKQSELSKQTATTVVIDQVNKEFVPKVSVVRTGSAIQFPNNDNIRHHVYSFSPVKSFELPLYEGTPANPVKFDHAGIVKLGCNIHDWMFAYIYIVDAPYNAISDKKGEVRLTDLPMGNYEVSVMHYNMDKTDKPENIHTSITSNENIELQFSIKILPEIHPRRAPMRLNRGGY